MILVSSVILVVTVLVNLDDINAHGMLMDPVNRGSAFRLGFDNPANYDDNGNYCGGYTVHFKKNHGKCGVCGDNYALPRPRPNENGGKYGRGLIVKKYKAGSKIVVTVDVTTNHLGHFSFALCPLKDKTDLETEECFDAHKLELVGGGYDYKIETGRSGKYPVKLKLPERFTCKQCVLRWQYVAGNNWGICEDGVGRSGCGDQETFRTCSDITIV